MFKFRRRVAWIGAPLLVGAALVLAWYDVLPGGWTLRGWVTPHAVRRARAQAEYAEKRLASFAEGNRAAPPGSIVWLGSSTIERFPLDALFPGHHHLDRGIGNESAAELLTRLDRSLPDSRPRLVVLYAGSIDFRALGRPPEAIARLARGVIARVEARYEPRVPVLVIGILPERDMSAAMVARLRETNAALAAVCADEPTRVFVDTSRPPIVLPDGSLDPSVAADRLHLAEPGYRALADWIRATGLL